MNKRFVPIGFRFSQRSLADFLECRRRFKLRYIDRLAWPAPVSDADADLESVLILGRDFHQAVHQDLIGVDPGELVAAYPDRRLEAWWQAFQAHALPQLPAGRRWPEAMLSAPVGDHWLVARFDLLIVTGAGDAVIVDWKTGAAPDVDVLWERMQTRVYPYVLAEAGACYNAGRLISPDHIRMAYWYAGQPHELLTFEYNAELHGRHGAELQALIEQIAALPAGAFPKVDDLAPCRRCNYRSYCHQEVPAAPVDGWVDEDIELELDFDLDVAPELDY